MRNLFRIAFALLLAGCPQENNPLEPDPCLAIPTPEGCEDGGGCLSDADCADGNDCTVDDCNEVTGLCESVDTCEAEPSGEAVLFANDNGSMFAGMRLDISPGYRDFMVADDAQLAAIPQGGCIETPFVDIEGDPELKSLGNVQVKRSGTVLVDLPPPTNLIYEHIFDDLEVDLGQTFDIDVTGADAVDPTLLAGILPVPPAFPALNFIDPNTNVLALAPTYSFAPTESDHVIVRFTFLDGPNVVTVSCRADGVSGTGTIDGPTYDRLPPTGTMQITFFNRTVRILNTTDGVVRSIRGTAQTTDNVDYQKL